MNLKQSTGELTRVINDNVAQLCSQHGISKAEYKALVRVDDMIYPLREHALMLAEQHTRDFIEKVCLDHGITREQFDSPQRKAEAVAARNITMHFLYHSTDQRIFTLSDIGWRCGKKDHATVLHAVREVNNRLETSRAYRENFNEEYQPRIDLLRRLTGSISRNVKR